MYLKANNISKRFPDESGKSEIYVCSFPNINSDKKMVSTDGGNCPLWCRDGSELFYLKGANIAVTVMAVKVETEPTLKPGMPKVLPIMKKRIFLNIRRLSTFSSNPVSAA